MGVLATDIHHHDGFISCHILARVCPFPVDGLQHGNWLQHGTWLSSCESIFPWTWRGLQHLQWYESQCGTNINLRLHLLLRRVALEACDALFVHPFDLMQKFC